MFRPGFGARMQVMVDMDGSQLEATQLLAQLLQTLE